MLTKKIVVLLAIALLSGLCAAQEKSSTFQPGRYGTLGLGYGLPYGGYGLSVDMYVFEPLALTVSIGSFIQSAGLEVGVKYLHGDASKLWRPQVILLYGVNGLLPSDTTSVEQTEVFNGITAGLGSQFMFGKKRRHGLDLGLTYVVSSALYKRLEELEGYEFDVSSRLGFYLGYRFAFEFRY